MIRINLAKTHGSKRGGRKSGRNPAASVLMLLLLAAAGGGAYYYMVYVRFAEELEAPAVAAPASSKDPFAALETAAGDVQGKPVEAGPGKQASDVPEKTEPAAAAPEKKPVEPVPAAPVAAAVPEKPVAPPAKAEPKAQPKPSTLVRTNMVEDVVKELESEPRTVSKLNAAYEEMTVAEKINYEALFGRNAFELVTRCAPPGIKLRSLEIENFQTVYASGVGQSREMIQEMFAAFKTQRGELLPKPLSYIKDDEKGGFQFVVTFKPRFGLELGDPFQALDHLGFREGLSANLKNFTRLAGENNFKLSAAPSQISAGKTGSYRRVVYKASGTTTYRDFQKFVLALHSEKVPCAIKKVSMTPVKNEQVRATAEILFTVKQ